MMGEPMPDFDLLVVGEINPDLILRGPDLSPAQARKLSSKMRQFLF